MYLVTHKNAHEICFICFEKDHDILLRMRNHIKTRMTFIVLNMIDIQVYDTCMYVYSINFFFVRSFWVESLYTKQITFLWKNAKISRSK